MLTIVEPKNAYIYQISYQSLVCIETFRRLRHMCIMPFFINTNLFNLSNDINDMIAEMWCLGPECGAWTESYSTMTWSCMYHNWE